MLYNIYVQPKVNFIPEEGGSLLLENIKVRLVPTTFNMEFFVTEKEYRRNIQYEMRDAIVKNIAEMIYNRLDVTTPIPDGKYHQVYSIRVLEDEEKVKYENRIRKNERTINNLKCTISDLEWKIKKFKSLGFWQLLKLAFNFKGRKNDTCYSW